MSRAIQILHFGSLRSWILALSLALLGLTACTHSSDKAADSADDASIQVPNENSKSASNAPLILPSDDPNLILPVENSASTNATTNEKHHSRKPASF